MILAEIYRLTIWCSLCLGGHWWPAVRITYTIEL